MNDRIYTSFKTHFGDVFHGYCPSSQQCLKYLTLHCTDGPAIIEANGNFVWYVDTIGYADVYDWAEAALKYLGNKKPTQDEIEDKVRSALASMILN